MQRSGWEVKRVRKAREVSDIAGYCATLLQFPISLMLSHVEQVLRSQANILPIELPSWVRMRLLPTATLLCSWEI